MHSMYIHNHSTDNHSADYWLNQADLDWEAKLSPVYFQPSGGEGFSPYPGQYVVHRGDTGMPLQVSGKVFKPLQPRPAVRALVQAVHDSGARLSNVTSVRQGARFYAHVELADRFQIAGENHRLLGMFKTALDGSCKPTVGYFLMREVCSNGLHVTKDKEIIFSQKQTGAFDLDALRRAFVRLMSEVPETIAGTTQQLESLAEIQVTREQVRRFFAELVHDKKILEAPAPVAPSNVTEIRQHPARVSSVSRMQAELADLRRKVEAATGEQPEGGRKVKQLMESYDHAPGANTPAARGTLYGALQAVTHHVDHVAGRSEDNRRMAAIWGVGDTLKNKAFEHALALAA